MSQIWYSASPSDAYLFFRPIPKNFPLKHYDWNFQDEPFGITWWTTGLINVTFWGGETARPISSPPPRRFTVALEIPKLRVAEKDCWCQENKDSLPRSFFSNFIGLHQQGLVSFDIYLSIKKWRFASSPKLVTHLDWPKNCLKKTTRREKKNNTPPDNSWNIPNLLAAIIIIVAKVRETVQSLRFAKMQSLAWEFCCAASSASGTLST